PGLNPIHLGPENVTFITFCPNHYESSRLKRGYSGSFLTGAVNDKIIGMSLLIILCGLLITTLRLQPRSRGHSAFRRIAALAANNASKHATFLIVPVPAAHVMSVVVVASMDFN